MPVLQSEAVDQSPDAPIQRIVGALVSIWRTPAGFVIAPDSTALLPAASLIVAPPVSVRPVTVRSEVF